jgi:hypothetical protein
VSVIVSGMVVLAMVFFPHFFSHGDYATVSRLAYDVF